MKIHCRGVLFDLDGVLVDSTPAVARVWTIWANKHGFVPEEVVRQALHPIQRLDMSAHVNRSQVKELDTVIDEQHHFLMGSKVIRGT